jgi:hypothetical protein
MCRWNFLESPPKLVVGQMYFNSLHPISIKKFKGVECFLWHLSCGIGRIESGWNNLELHHGCTCSYEEVCQYVVGFGQYYVAKSATFLGLITMVESIPCFEDTFVKWHKKVCVTGNVIYVELIIFPFILFRRRGPQLPWWSGNIFLWKRLSLEMGRKKWNWNLFTRQLFPISWLIT